MVMKLIGFAKVLFASKKKGHPLGDAQIVSGNFGRSGPNSNDLVSGGFKDGIEIK